MWLQPTIGRSIALWIALLHIGTPTVYARDVGDRLYPIIEITDRQLEAFDLTDGSLEEWKTYLSASVLNRLDFEDFGYLYGSAKRLESSLPDPNDLDFQFWLGWNQSTKRLYVAAERFDNVHLNAYEGRNENWYESGELDPIWAYDSLELLVDGDHSGGEYGFHPDCCATEEEWKQVQNSQAQQYYVLDQSPKGQLIKYSGVGLWVNRPPYAAAGGAISPSPLLRRVDRWVGETHRIVTEFYVTAFDSLVWDSPEASKVSPLFPNKIIGFSLSVSDFDTAPYDYHGFHRLYVGSSATWHNADYFVDGLLVEAPATVVESWSWGRIKAAFGFADGE